MAFVEKFVPDAVGLLCCRPLGPLSLISPDLFMIRSYEGPDIVYFGARSIGFEVSLLQPGFSWPGFFFLAYHIHSSTILNDKFIYHAFL